MLLTHEHHADNLDATGRELLPVAGVVITTLAGAASLGGDAVGLAHWATTRLHNATRPTIDITATPCRHGPPLSRRVAGDVVGFALRWDGQDRGVLWISGDTVLYDGVRSVADRSEVDAAIIHLGGVRFPVTGPIHYTMSARDAVRLFELMRPRTVIPVHYEGWSHFSQSRADAQSEFPQAGHETARAVSWMPFGVATDPDCLESTT